MQDIINKLFDILLELDARENSNNCIIPELSDKGWDELCIEGIKLFEQLK